MRQEQHTDQGDRAANTARQGVHNGLRFANRAQALQQLQNVEGWFYGLDQRLFAWCLEWQAAHGTSGDLVELGVYKGKSAILLGMHTKHQETLVVCDLFGRPADESEISRNACAFYSKNLQRADFEANYLDFFETLPRIVEGPSSAILTHVAPHSARFVHIDASHAYANVRQDILAARTMLCPQGLVVLDDYRTAHTPGVAAAVWESVFRDDLKPICVSETKLYATWDAVDAIQTDLCGWLDGAKQPYDVHDVNGQRLVRIATPKKVAAPRTTAPTVLPAAS